MSVAHGVNVLSYIVDRQVYYGNIINPQLCSGSFEVQTDDKIVVVQVYDDWGKLLMQTARQFTSTMRTGKKR